METTHPISGHETRDASVRPILITGLSLVAVAALVGLIVYGTFRYFTAHPAVTAPFNPMVDANRPTVPPAPQIQEHPTIELQQLRTEEDHVLSTYGWVDKNAGVVRIPVDRAMELQLERGFPVRKAAKK